jgi:poly-gamma-glutamate synthesis protein (capsule biosynthesis protein)
MDVAPVLASADLATVNLEGDLCGAPYGSNGTAPQTMAQALRNAGVDMIQLANSYAINRGISGLMTTINSVKQAGMEPVGVFADDEQFESKRGFSLFQVQGVRIAVVAFTKGMDGTALVPGYENCVNILYTDYSTTYQKIDKDKIGQVMEAVQAQKPDITIALLHWGSELNDNISDSQKSICQLLQSYGTDAIIGTHPHFVQEIDFDSENGTLVAYSLGDLIGDIPEAGTEYSIILDLEITKDHKTGESAITNYSYTPIFTVAEENHPLRVLRIREAIAAYEEGYMNAVSEETYKAMQNALERIEDRITGE